MRTIERVELYATEDHRLFAGDEPLTKKDGTISVAPIFIQMVDESVIGAFAPSPPPTDGKCTILYRVWKGDDYRVGVGIAQRMLDLSMQQGCPLWRQKWIVSYSSRNTGELEPAKPGWTSRRIRQIPLVAFAPGGFLDERVALEALAGLRSVVKPGDPIPRRPRVAAVASSNGHANGNGKKDGVLKVFAKKP